LPTTLLFFFLCFLFSFYSVVGGEICQQFSSSSLSFFPCLFVPLLHSGKFETEARSILSLFPFFFCITNVNSSRAFSAWFRGVESGQNYIPRVENLLQRFGLFFFPFASTLLFKSIIWGSFLDHGFFSLPFFLLDFLFLVHKKSTVCSVVLS